MSIAATEVEAKALDGRDELARFRDKYYLPPGQIYLDGNSLGLLSTRAEQKVLEVMQAWKALGVAGWTQAAPPWFTLAEEVARRTAPLLGADPEEVATANSTTVNLHQLLATLYWPEGRRAKILADELSFPSDLYALQSHLRLRGRDPGQDLLLVPSRDGFTLAEQDVADALTEEVQLAVLPSVLYQSGQLLDIAWLTDQAHRRGVVIGFDCSHSVGAVPHRLSDWGVDFAFWSTYKYLNSGPGGVAGLYLNRRHFGRPPGLAGWFGSRKDRQFDMAPTLEPAPDAGAMQIGTPPVLSMAPLLGALEIIVEAGIERIRRKSLELTGYLMDLAEAELAGFGFTFANPREDHRRGGHVSLVHPEASRISQALRRAGVVPDYRPPRIVRLAPVALYNSFHDCFACVRRLKAVMTERAYELFPPERALIP